jgi:hypothetical protein
LFLLYQQCPGPRRLQDTTEEFSKKETHAMLINLLVPPNDTIKMYSSHTLHAANSRPSTDLPTFAVTGVALQDPQSIELQIRL